MPIFSGILNETTLKYHSKLNPIFWDDRDRLRPEIHDKLMQIASKWMEFAHINNEDVWDIIFTGGNANYNYTKFSDIDLHVVVDLTKIDQNRDFVDDYMKTKKSLWEMKHNISIHGYPVELYTQDVNESYHSGQGVYSIKNSIWVQKPIFQHLNFNKNSHLDRKVATFKRLIFSALDSNSIEYAQKLKDRLNMMRSAGIQHGGEFSFENLVFKDLRNEGWVEKLKQHLQKLKDEELSI